MGLQASEATVRRILRYLQENKSLPPQARQQTHPKRSTASPRNPPTEGQPPHQSGEMVQAGILFLRDPSGRWVYQLTVCNPVSKLTAAELITTPSAHNMRAAFERILKIFPVVIRGTRPTTAPSSAALRGTPPGVRHGHAGHSATQSQTEWLSRAVPAHLAQGALRNLLRRNPLDGYRRMPGASCFTTTMVGPIPHLVEGRPSGIYANTLERTSVAT